MPGRKHHFGMYMEDPILYRSVAAADTNPVGGAGVEAISETIDMYNRVWAHINLIHAQVIAPASLTQFDIEVYGSFSKPAVDGCGAERWSLIDRLTARTRSTFISMADVPPCEKIKILITNTSGSFSSPVKIYVVKSY